MEWFFDAFIAACSIGVVLAFVTLVRDSQKAARLERELEELDKVELSSPPDEAIRLTLENWAEFERAVHNLKQVIVVADIVQEPHDALLDAVMHNFSRGVRYSFIVSRSKAIAEMNGYLKIFEGLATIAIAKHHLKMEVSDLVSIESFEDEWNGVPFVFYRIEDTDAPITAETRFQTLAFWGDKWNAGIANNYQSLPSPVADALATALMAGAPQPVKKLLEKLEKDKFSEPAEMVEANGLHRLRVVDGGKA